MRTNLGTSPSDTWNSIYTSVHGFIDSTTSGHLDYTMETNLSSNNSGNYSVEGQELFFYKNEQLTFLCILFTFIVVGNSIVLAAVGLSRTRSRMNFFIMHLAAADLLNGLISVLIDIIWKVTVSFYAGDVMCKVVKYMQVVITFASTYMLVSLSIDRFDAIARPMSFSGSGTRARILVGASWALSFVFSLPSLVLSSVENFPEAPGPVCVMMLPEPAGRNWKLYLTLVAVAVFILPAVIIIICYGVIIYIIWKSSHFLAPSTPSKRLLKKSSRKADGFMKDKSSTNSHSKDEISTSSRGLIPKAKIRTIKMTFIIVLVFVFCWSPYFIFNFLHMHGYIPRTRQAVAISIFIQSLAPLNSAANPVIYGIFSTRICTNLRKVPLFDWLAQYVCCWFCGRTKRRQSAISTSGAATEYSSMIDTEMTLKPTSTRRPSGVPFVKNMINAKVDEKDQEILMQNLKRPDRLVPP